MIATQYQPVTSEETPIDMFLLESVDNIIKSRKIELIFAALSSFSNPYIKKDILNSPSFIESVTMIKQLSPSGKLSLARALLNQIS